MRNTILSKFAVLLVAGVTAAAAAYALFDQSNSDKARASTPAPQIPVISGVAEKKDVPQFVRGIGTVQAYNAVTIKSRVDGEIVKVLFTEGQFVKAGDPLIQIDPRPFQAALEAATATLKRNEAQLTGAALDLERYGKLINSGFQSRQSYDQQQAIVGALKGSIAADKAAIETARLNLTYADIRAPIAGRTGQRLVDVGNLVQAGQPTSLVTITQIRPIFVNFTVPQDYADAIRHNQQAGALTVLAYASDDKTLLAEGKLSLIDNQIDVATGTLRLKATFANADERLWPGEFVNVRLVLSMRSSVVTVPQRAVMQGANGYYAYVIRPDGTAQRRTVEIAGMQDGLAIVDKGIESKEQVVIDGQYRLSDGVRVKAEDAKPIAQPPVATAKDG
jgi:multidrug efflux system membrane fusion protein